MDKISITATTHAPKIDLSGRQLIQNCIDTMPMYPKTKKKGKGI